MSPSQTASKRQQHAILLALTVTIATIALALVFGIASVMWSIVIGYFVYLRQTRSHRSLLWLRRFHQSEPERLRFQFALNRACAALCVPITIQDSSYRTSYLAGGSQLILLIPLFFGMSFVLALMTAIAVYIAADVTLGVSSISIALAALIGIGILIASGLAAKKFLNLKGHKQLTRENAVPTLLKLLERIRRQKSFALGTLVLKCGDEFWREVVQECMRGVDVVLIDVSDITENVLWEIQAMAAISPNKPMLLAYGATAPEEQQLPEEIRNKLGAAIGDERLAKTPCIYYPAKQPPVGRARGRVYSTLTDQIKSALDQTLADGGAPEMETSQEVPDKTAGSSIFVNFLKLFLAITCGLFVIFWVVFGPYNLKNALEAAMGSAIIAVIVALPFLFWQMWKKRT